MNTVALPFNRARFLFEIIETVLEHVEPGRVGIKVGPMHLSGPFVANADTLPNMEYVVKKLNDYDLAHLLLMGATTDFTGSPLEQLASNGMFQHFRPLYQGHLIANVDMTQERGNRLIEAGLADSIAFGRPYIANPDLPERFLGALSSTKLVGQQFMHPDRKGTPIILHYNGWLRFFRSYHGFQYR
jgi:N-ethylmaleimide reductase